MAHGLGELSAHQTFAGPINACVAAVGELAAAKADKEGIAVKELERQLRLHLPAVEPELLRHRRYREAYEQVLPAALARALSISSEQNLVADAAQLKLLADADYACRRELRLESTTAPPLALRFKQIEPSVGFHYQAELHYLLAVRGDTLLHFGVFLPGAERPMAYIAVSRCDRPYMIDGLPVAGYGIDDVVVLTRMYGLPGLPANVMSLMTKHVIRAVREVSRARIMLTAYNPLLGFSGTVYRASGFHPFATAPVGYGYDDRGHYTTRRLADKARLSEVETPPNVLMARGLDRLTQAALGAPRPVVRISDDDYWRNVTVAGRARRLDTAIEELLRSLKAARTTAPNGCRYVACNAQCDVSSVWLVRELKRVHQVQATYCYGTVSLPIHGSEHHSGHSWVEITRGENVRLVIDVARQFRHDAGGGPGMCTDHRLLAEKGIRYDALVRLTIDQLPARRQVWSRFAVLDDMFHHGQGVTHDSVS